MFKKLIKPLPRRALSNYDILEHSNDIPFFRGVYMRDELPRKPRKTECGIINLDSSNNKGTHWVAYAKVDNYCQYFNSYGNLKPPLELVKYLKNIVINYNYERYQRYNTVNCGHLCIQFLKKFWNSK